MPGVESEFFVGISIPLCLLGEMSFALFCSLRAAEVDCCPCRKLRRPLEPVWLRPQIVLHASEQVRDSLPLILLVWGWKKGVEHVNRCGMGALRAGLPNKSFMNGAWALRNWVPLCLPEGDDIIPCLGITNHWGGGAL